LKATRYREGTAVCCPPSRLGISPNVRKLVIRDRSLPLIPCMTTVSSERIAPSSLPYIPLRIVLASKRVLTVSPFQVCYGGRYLRPWVLRFNQSRLHHACRTCGTSQYTLSCLAAFPICYFPLCLSAPGRSGVLRGNCCLPLATQSRWVWTEDRLSNRMPITCI
jgi:hypothetical protein